MLDPLLDGARALIEDAYVGEAFFKTVAPKAIHKNV